MGVIPIKRIDIVRIRHYHVHPLIDKLIYKLDTIKNPVENSTPDVLIIHFHNFPFILFIFTLSLVLFHYFNRPKTQNKNKIN